MSDELRPMVVPISNHAKFKHVEFKCIQCSDTGVVLAELKDGPPGPYAFRCNCYRGQSDKRRYPPWSLANAALYRLVPLGGA